MKTLLPSALFGSLLTLTQLNAAPFFYEGFDFGGTAIPDISGTNGWSDFNTGNNGLISYATSGLSYSDGSNSLGVSGGSALAADTGNTEIYYSQNVSRPGDALNTGNSVYFSFLNKSVGDGSRSFGLTTDNTNNNFGLRVYRVGGFWQLQVGGTSDLSAVSTNNFDGMILGRITMQDGVDLVEIWANPNLASEGSLGAPIASLSANTPGFNHVRLEGGNFPTDLQFDEVRLGTSFSDVTTIPEPSTLILLGIAVVGLFMKRRLA